VENDFLFLVMPLCDLGTLENYVRENVLTSAVENPKSFERDTLFLIEQIVEGIGYMHEKQILHRDIKPDNCLVKTESVSDGGDTSITCPCIKITDFGLSKNLNVSYSKSIAGTFNFMAPEIKRASGKVSFKADVFSIGMTIAQVFFRVNVSKLKQPEEQKEFLKEHFSKKFPNLPMKDAFQKLILQCISEDPDQRPSCKEILQILVELKKVNQGSTIALEQEQNKEAIGDVKENLKGKNLSSKTDLQVYLDKFEFSHCIPSFLENGFDDLSLIAEMEKEDLNLVGISLPGHILRFKMMIKDLQHLKLSNFVDVSGNVDSFLKSIGLESFKPAMISMGFDSLKGLPMLLTDEGNDYLSSLGFIRPGDIKRLQIGISKLM